jgi:uncharacterized protein (TIGR02722 family)
MDTRKLMAGLTVGSLFIAGCNGNWKIDRKAPEDSADLDYRFNDQDAREATQQLMTDCLSRPWVSNWSTAHNGQAPIVYLGNVKNDTQDYNVNSVMITEVMQKEMINSGRVRVKAQKDARPDIRDERLDTKYNDPSTVKAVAKELNADFALVGNVQQSLQQNNNATRVTNYYQINMELINVETAEKVWIKDAQIKKTARKK